MTAVAALLQGVSALLVLLGVAFLFAGTLGVVRLPDLYSRAHAASKCDSVGAGSLLIGLLLHDGLAFEDFKLLLLALLVLVSGPTTAHALARAGHRTGLAAWLRHGGERP
jgi:multicomponent Na+:H+ antiporter subunit G